MKTSPHRSHVEAAIQLSCLLVITVCGLCLFSMQLLTPVGAQTCSTPPNGGPDDDESFPPNQLIEVKVDALYADAERQSLETGAKKWNSTNCSGVTFIGFQSFTMPNYTGAAPDYSIWIQKDDPGNGFNGGVFKRIDYLPDLSLRLLSARVKLLPSLTYNNPPHYFVYLGTHEFGHTLG